MTMDQHERYEENVAAYLLGALTEEELTEFEAHLAGCELCRLDYQRLRVAAEALPRAVEPLEAPDSLRSSLMATVRAEARPGSVSERTPSLLQRFRDRLGDISPALAAVSAAAVLAVGVLAGWGISELANNGGVEKTYAASTRVPGGSATLTVPEDRRGASLTVHGMPSPGAGRVYEVWLRRGSTYVPAGSLFDVGGNGTGSAAIPRDLHGVDGVAVTREPRGGTKQPTEKPVMTVDLS
ncbi:MAG: anti-sigma factor domain-containing protein [Thermoleophilaceae bacterium]